MLFSYRPAYIERLIGFNSNKHKTPTDTNRVLYVKSRHARNCPFYLFFLRNPVHVNLNIYCGFEDE